MPPNFRVVSLLACVKLSNMVGILFSAIPMPVSFISKQRVTFFLSSETSLILNLTSPRSVNLMALLIRLLRICVSLVGSPVTNSGIVESFSRIRLID